MVGFPFKSVQHYYEDLKRLVSGYIKRSDIVQSKTGNIKSNNLKTVFSDGLPTVCSSIVYCDC